MKKKILLFLLPLLVLTQMSFGMAKADDTKVVIFHTNDTHGRVKEGKYDGMGFAKIDTIVDKARAEEEHVLLLDGGDTFHGTTFASLSKGESIVSLMNAMGYDAMVTGNHDYDYGYNQLVRLEEEANFPILAANVYNDNDERVFTPYIIKQFGTLKVAIVGFATPETKFKTHPKNVETLTFSDPAEEAKVVLKSLKGKAHVVIALCHLGVDEESTYTSKALAEQVDGIDLIIDGHSHTPLAEPMVVNGTYIVQTGEHDKNLGKVVLDYKDHEANFSAELISKKSVSDVVESEQIVTIVEDIAEANKKIEEVVVGNTDVALDGERANVRTGSTNMGVLITDALLDITGADLALTNGGGIRKSINAGPVTKGEIIGVLPFGNTVVVKEVTGAQFLAALENGLAAYPEPAGSYPHTGGCTIVFDETKPAGSRVQSVTLSDGTVLEADGVYSLATNDFLAAGGDKYTMLKDTKTLAEYGTMDDIVVDYMNK